MFPLHSVWHNSVKEYLLKTLVVALGQDKQPKHQVEFSCLLKLPISLILKKLRPHNRPKPGHYCADFKVSAQHCNTVKTGFLCFTSTFVFSDFIIKICTKTRITVGMLTKELSLTSVSVSVFQAAPHNVREWMITWEED